MAAGATYEPIATQVLTTTTATVTFSSIPNTWTDIRLVSSMRCQTPAAGYYYRVNGTASQNTSSGTYVYGTGASAVSSRQTNSDLMGGNNGLLSSTNPILETLDFMSYANPNIYKSILFQTSADMNGSGRTYSGIWRVPITAAITSISINTGDFFLAGDSFTLYGIKAA